MTEGLNQGRFCEERVLKLDLEGRYDFYRGIWQERLFWIKTIVSVKA